MKKTKYLVLSALGAAFISVCSWIVIPGAIPFTLQTFAIYCILCLFGAKIGISSILLYIFIGVLGVPVFSNFNSGIGALLGNTGGFIIGFIFIGIHYAIGTKFSSKHWIVKLISLWIGTLFCYVFGSVWFSIIYTNTKEPIAFSMVFSVCVLPFIIPDILKLFLATFVSKKVEKIMPHK